MVEMGEICCPFCNEKLQAYTVENDTCCDMTDIITDHGMRVCLSCGSVVSQIFENEYIDFYENMYKIRRKSVYHRNYHIENTIDNICVNNKIQIQSNDKYKIYRIFQEIAKILFQVNNGRKRMISIRFILRKVFKMMHLPYHVINISKSKKTIKNNESYWTHIMSLIGDKIQSIINL